MFKTVLHVVLILFLGLTNAYTQSSGSSLREVLTQLEGKYGITFSYADDPVNKLIVTDFDTALELGDQLDELANQTGLAFEASSESIYIVKNVSRDLCARITTDDLTVLQGAQVFISNQPTNFVADEQGFVRFSTSLTFQDTIAVRHLGYQDSFFSINSLVGENCANIQMSFEVTRLNEVVITNYLTNGINADLSDHTLRIQTQDLGLLPGETDGDILLALKSLPGITTPNSKAGNLHMRGGTTDQTLLLFDNIPIYHKGHYFGTISPYNPAVVQSVSVHRSGFDPSLGGRVGGVIKLESKKSIINSPAYQVGINSYYSALSAQVPISEKFMVSGAIRNSYPNSFKSPKLDAINTMVYQPSNLSFGQADLDIEITKQDYSFLDYNLGAVYNMGQGQISFSFLGIGNTQEIELTRISRPRRINSQFDLVNRGGNIEWQQFWSSKVTSKVSIMKSTYQHQSIIRTEVPDTAIMVNALFKSNIDDFGLNFDLEMALNEDGSSLLNVGHQINRHEISNVIEGLSGPFPIEADATIQSSIINLKSQPLAGLFLSTGLRTNHYSLTDEWFIEPRILSSYSISKFLSLKASAALHSQFINQKIFFDFDDTKSENFSWELSNQAVPVVRSKQLMLGAIWNKNDIIIDLELYRKKVEDLAVDNPNATPPPPPPGGPQMGAPPRPPLPIPALGELNVQGLDLLVRKHWLNLDMWVSYSFTKTEMIFDEINQLPFKTYYDQPHVLNIGGTLTSKRWKFSAGWQHSSGIPRYTNTTFFPTPGPSTSMGSVEIPAETNDGRFPSQHQLDIAVVYDITPSHKKWRGSIGLSVLNVYAHENLVEQNFYVFGQVSRIPTLDQRYGIGFAPNLMLNLQF
ncbi:MAG: TonB-dependent receptor [Cyclobacteriaceae bacterium]